jgi:hypothetical protein
VRGETVGFPTGFELVQVKGGFRALLQIQFCTEGIQEFAPATEVKQFAVGVLR